MAKQSIESMYEIMRKMREKMEDILQDAQDLNEAANTYGGEISRVISEQLTKYFAPSIKKLLDDTNTPGSVVGLVNFMDSVPLSFTRVNPSLEDMAPVTPDNPQFDMPATLGNDLDNIPQNASFNSMETTPQGNMEFEGNAPETSPQTTIGEERPEDTMVMESTQINKNDHLTEVTKYVVVRTTDMGGTLGEISNLKDAVIGEFNSEESALAKAATLNETVTPEEKEIFGTEYKVVEKETNTTEN